MKFNNNLKLLKGKIFVITGTFSVKRDVLKERIESFGGKVTGSVSNSTSYVLLGNNEDDKKSSKYKKAISLNKTILEENQFEEMIQELLK